MEGCIEKETERNSAKSCAGAMEARLGIGVIAKLVICSVFGP